MKRRIIALTLTISVFISAIFISAVNPVADDEGTATEITEIIAGGGFNSEEDFALWKVAAKNDRTVELDAENPHSGTSSLKVTMPTAYYTGTPKPLKLTASSTTGASATFDPEASYNLEMYIKTSEDFSGSVYVRIRQGMSYVMDGTNPDLLLLGAKNEGGKAFTGWTKLSTPTISLEKQDITMIVYVNGTGTIWIDDVNIKADKNLVLNGGFDINTAEWNNWGSLGDGVGKEISHTKTETCASPGALKLHIDEDTEGMIYMASSGIVIDPKKQYTLSIDVKCEGVELGGAFVRLFQHYTNEAGDTASTWLRCYGAEDALTTGGTTDWQHFEVKLAGWEPTIQNFNLMIYLQTSGTVYYDNISIVEREKMSVAAGEIGADPEPGAVEPMTQVSLVSSDDSSDIYYTLDGSDPTNSSTARLYDSNYPIPVSEDMKIRACAVSEESIGEVFDFDYTCPKGKIEEDALWAELNTAAQITLDSDVKKFGNNSMKIQGAGGNRYASTGDIRIDGAFDYKLEFWVKTEELLDAENAYINVFMAGSGSVINEIDGRVGAYVKTTNIIKGIKETQDWTKYEILIDDLDGFWPTINLTAGLMNESGAMWIDGVKLTMLPYELYPLTASGDGKTYGNNYYRENLFGNFSLDQGFILTNNTNNIESGTLTYSVFNDKDMENSLGGGDVNVSVFPHSMATSSVNLTMCGSYGTYTVKFEVTNARGYTYPAGSIKVAVIRDVSDKQDDSILGVNSNFEDSTHLKKSGMTMMRLDFHWKNAEVTEGTLTVQERFDNIVESANENNIDVMLILGDGDGPSWFKPGNGDRFPKTDEEIAQFVNYTKMSVEYFKGKVKYYELYNETDWGSIRCKGSEYAKLLKAFYKAVKEVDPTANVVAGACTGTNIYWTRDVFEALDGEVCMDYWSCHPYANPKSPEEREWLASIEAVEDAAISILGQKVPLLLDELGWSDNESGGGVNQQEQLKWYVRIMAYADSLDYVERVCLYCDVNHGSANKYAQELRWGMFGSSFAAGAYARPFVPALTNWVYMTDGYSVESTEKTADGLHIFKYSGEGKDKDVYMLWTEDTDMTAKITTASTDGRLYDIFGNMLPVGYEENSLTTEVNGDVIYLTLKKGEKINSIEILKDESPDTNKPEDKNDQDPDQKNDQAVSSGDNTSNSGDNSFFTNTDNNTDTENKPTTEKQLVTKKKVIKKVTKAVGGDDSFNYLPVIIGCAAAVVAAGAAVFLIIFFKKRKKRSA